MLKSLDRFGYLDEAFICTPAHHWCQETTAEVLDHCRSFVDLATFQPKLKL